MGSPPPGDSYGGVGKIGLLRRGPRVRRSCFTHWPEYARSCYHRFSGLLRKQNVRLQVYTVGWYFSADSVNVGRGGMAACRFEEQLGEQARDTQQASSRYDDWSPAIECREKGRKEKSF